MLRITAWITILLLATATLGCGGKTDESPGPEPDGGPAATTGSAAPSEARAPNIQELYEAVQRDPDDPEAHHTFALALHQAGRREEAVPHFEKVVELRPDKMTHQIELGVAYASVSRLDDARSAFQRVIEAAPGHPIALHHLANLARGRGDLPEAISLYQQAVENDPDYLMAYFHLAEVLRQAQQFPEAYRNYEKVVEMDPTAPPELAAFDAALFQLANLDLQMGATERAVEILEVLVESVPDHPQAHLMLGQALIKLGREEEGRRELLAHQQLSAAERQPQEETP